MHFTHLSLVDFRSYHTVDVEFDDGVNVLVGPNGQGKTNLVEALGYVATLSSHRVPTDAALVRAGAERAVIRTRIVRGDRASTIEVEIAPGRANRARINRAPATRSRDILGIARTVLFAPEDLALIKGDPQGRRRFLDTLAVQVLPRMAAVQGDYDRVLRQRTALLKSLAGSRTRMAAAGATLEVWDAKLAELGGQITALRQRIVAALAVHVQAAYTQISGTDHVARIAYTSSVDRTLAGLGTAEADPEGHDVNPVPVDNCVDLDSAAMVEAVSAEAITARMLTALHTVRAKEIDRGLTLVGPHRDDMSLVLGELPAKGYASHGESWSFAFALRLASYHLLSSPADGVRLPWVDWGPEGRPTLVLDDVFAELDGRRREQVADAVGELGQVLITAAVPQDVPGRLHQTRFDVGHGQVRRVTG